MHRERVSRCYSTFENQSRAAIDKLLYGLKAERRGGARLGWRQIARDLASGKLSLTFVTREDQPSCCDHFVKLDVAGYYLTCPLPALHISLDSEIRELQGLFMTHPTPSDVAHAQVGGSSQVALSLQSRETGGLLPAGQSDGHGTLRSKTNTPKPWAHLLAGG